jgi:hypothetical protein
MSSPLDDIGFHVLLQLMALSSIVGLIAGAALIVRPDWLVQMGKFSNRWISTRKVDRSLEQWVNLDKWFFQHHRASGSLMLAGAAWVIGFFIFSGRSLVCRGGRSAPVVASRPAERPGAGNESMAVPAQDAQAGGDTALGSG